MAIILLRVISNKEVIDKQIVLNKATMKAQNVLVQKTIPIFYIPNQTMYPGAQATLLSHQYILSGAEELEGMTCQLWWLDPVAKFFRQGASVKIVNSSFTLMEWQLGMAAGSLCLVFDIATNGVSNVFTYLKGSSIIDGNSVNLGTAPNPPNYTTGGASQLPPAPVIVPAPSPTTNKRKR